MNQKPGIVIIAIVTLIASFVSVVESAAAAKQCGLPPFLGDLPNAEKKEVVAVWKDYKQGEDCSDQRRETQEIIDNLPSDVRAVVFGRPPAFLKDAPAAVKKMFRDIMQNKTLSHDEKKQELSKLAEEVLNRRQLNEFKRYLEDHERQRREFQDKVNNLSPAAKEAYEKLENLKAERAKIIEEMDDDVRKELRDLFRKPKSRKRPHS